MEMKTRLCWLSLMFMALTATAHAKAYFAPKAEMIDRAEAIAIAQISGVTDVEEDGDHWTYRQKAEARVEQVLKGKLPLDITLHGNETFICAQMRLAPGRYLIFLRHDRKLWVGANWHLSLRPITDRTVEWYADDKGIELKPVPLSEVLQEIQKLLTMRVYED